jgi:hypothetical protein
MRFARGAKGRPIQIPIAYDADQNRVHEVEVLHQPKVKQHRAIDTPYKERMFRVTVEVNVTT